MPVTLSPYALTDLATVKLLLGIADSDTSQDDLLTLMINFSSQLIESLTGRKFAKREDQIEYYDGPGDKHLILRNRPVIAVNNIWVDADRLFLDSSKLSADQPAVQYVVDEEAGILSLTGSYPFFNDFFGTAPRIIKLDYDYGYETIPADVATGAAMLAVHYKQNNKNLNVKSVSIGSFSQTYGDAKALPDSVKGFLMPYMDMPMVG